MSADLKPPISFRYKLVEPQISDAIPTDDDQTPVNDSHSLVRLLIFAGLIFAGFMVLNVLTPVYFQEAWVAIILMNLVVGQLTLICIWGTLVEGTFWVRLPWTILLLVVSWAALCVGLYVDKSDGKELVDSAKILGIGVVWFYGFAISYIPLKVAALLFGWRITLIKSTNSDAAASNHSIRDMIIGTAILAMTLAIGRLLVPGELPSWSSILGASGIDSSSNMFVLFIFSIISLIVKLPCIWIALATPVSDFKARAVKWILLSGLLGVGELVLLTIVLGPPGGNELELLSGLVFGHMAMAVTMLGVLFALRQFGYSISRRKNQIS